MSLNEVRNVVLLFSNPTWVGGRRVPSTIVNNITAVSSQIAYSEHLQENFTTLSTNAAQPIDGVIQGLLYVPDLDRGDPCENLINDYMPRNVTRQANLPPTTYNLIAVAPWINANCTISYLKAASFDPLRAFVFYLPDNSTLQPPPASDPVWKLDEGGGWKSAYRFPIYAVSGASGAGMVQALSLYSGNLTQVPYGRNISATYHPDPDDYVRVWTELRVSFDSSLPGMWVFFLIIAGVLLAVIGGTTLAMRYIQSRRRSLLQRRVMRGEIDLEASGIKRMTVPPEHIISFPLFTYIYHGPKSASAGSPQKKPGTAMKAAQMLSDRHILHSQPACFICLEDYESKVTIIRELPCGHIFHPDCIDEFLGTMSSLCPLCKKSNLPLGYSPPITNAMVKRELALRQLRSSMSGTSARWRTKERTKERTSSWSSWGSIIKQRLHSIPTSPMTGISAAEPLQIALDGHEVHDEEMEEGSGSAQTRRRMQELATRFEDIPSDDEKTPCKWRFRNRKDSKGS